MKRLRKIVNSSVFQGIVLVGLVAKIIDASIDLADEVKALRKGA